MVILNRYGRKIVELLVKIVFKTDIYFNKWKIIFHIHYFTSLSLLHFKIGYSG